MIKKLRLRFLWVSTLILALVISVVMGIVYWITSGIIMSQTRILMEVILDNDGALPQQWEYDSIRSSFLALNEESIYELRYFTVLMKGEEVQITHINSAIKEDVAEEIAEKLFNNHNDYGSVAIKGGRRINYMKKSMDDGSVMIALLDTTSKYSLIRVIMLYMSALWLVVLLLYVLVMVNYSKKLVKPFEENDERQKRFITNASHELKTPLAVISANTELLELMNGKNKWTESTKKHVDKLQELIEDLVVLTRLEEMKDITLEDTDISVIVTETVEPFRQIVQTSGKRFETRIEPGLKAKTEKRSFQQLVSILTENAVKYCDEGGNICTELTSDNKGKHVKLCIKNTYESGRNMDFSCFFERFYRANLSHNSDIPGFGIGLSMGGEIAERLGGKLEAGYEDDTISFTVIL